MSLKLCVKSSAGTSGWQDRVRFRGENQTPSILDPLRIHIDAHVDSILVEVEHTKNDVNLRGYFSRCQSHPLHQWLLVSKYHVFLSRLTYPLILALTYEKPSAAFFRSRFHLKVVFGLGTDPNIVQILVFHQELGELSFRVVVGDVSSLCPFPCVHAVIVFMNGHMSADSALPVAAIKPRKEGLQSG
jgi:hypothetical protein